MKIVYCMNSICGLGGIQQATVVKANALAELADNEVYIIVTDNKAEVKVTPPSPKVHLIDLQVDYYADDFVSRWKLIKGTIVKGRKHRKLLAETLREINPDIVVSVGQSEKYMVAEIKGNWKTVRELHYNKNYRQMHAQNLFNRLLGFLSDMWDYHYKIWHYDQIVVLTHEDKKDNWRSNPRIEVIPNPVTFAELGGTIS